MPKPTLIEQLRQERNFAKLATIYRHIAKARDEFAAIAPDVPNGGLDPTVKALEDTLRQLRDVAKEITGEDVPHDALMINWGDEFGAAAPPDTSTFAGIDPRTIDVIGAAAAASPTPVRLTDADLVEVIRGGAGAQFSDAASGAVALVPRRRISSAEALRVYDALGPFSIDAAAPGCLQELIRNRVLAMAAAGGIAAVAIVLVAIFLLRGDGDGDDGTGAAVSPTQAGAPTEPADEPVAEDLFAFLPDESRGDIAWFTPRIEGFQLSAAYVPDPEDDAFTAYTEDAPYAAGAFANLLGGIAFTGYLDEDDMALLACDARNNGMEVYCPPGASGTPPPGEYVIGIASLGVGVDERVPEQDYSINFLLEDPGAMYFRQASPGVPYDPLTGTSSHWRVLAIGTARWSFEGRAFDGQSFQFQPQQPPYTNARFAAGGRTAIFAVPAETVGAGTYYDFSANVHQVDTPFTPDTFAIDVLGDLPRRMQYAISWSRFDGGTQGDETADRIRAALPEFAAWRRSGDNASLIEHLHPSATAFYTSETCEAYLSAAAPDPTFDFVREILLEGPLPWTWVYNGRTIGTIDDAYTWRGEATQGGTTREVEFHFGWDDMVGLQVFIPCEPPAPPPP
ncbi:MAG TPA: hypothetical protein VNM91_09550 [Dehalococcoidia bacterium]|nr:hypothetical protein [Dehalococcoidia bacterium]